MAEYTFDEEVTLIAEQEQVNAIGDIDTAEKHHRSYAEIVSVFETETYEALAVGLKPEFKVVLPSWYDDYSGEQLLEYKGVRYRIIRAYKAKDLSAELTVSRLKANVPDLDTLASGLSVGG